MIKYALKGGEREAVVEAAASDDLITPIPRVSIQAFCETAETASVVQAASEDRRMAKAHLKVQMGGIAAAAEAYRGSPPPTVIITEWESRGEVLLTGLDQLAEVCAPATRVIAVA